MKRQILRPVLTIAAFLAAVAFIASPAVAGEKENYEAKIKENDATIAIIAGVINYVCPKIAPRGSKMCDTADPVKSAVALATHIGEEGAVQHEAAAEQFFDAVEQFKQHFPLRAKAKQLAKKGDYKGAFGYEDFAWHYLVKTATKGINSKKMVDHQ